MADKVKCVECGSQKVWAKGQVPSRTGPKQRYVCFTCGRTFYKPKVEPKLARAKKAKSSKKKAG
jgi:transposase-like protein